ncbi:hypothetical protein AN666_26430, partial [Enterobacter hormaechei]
LFCASDTDIKQPTFLLDFLFGRRGVHRCANAVNIIGFAARKFLLIQPDQGSSQKTESMVTPVFATPILTTSWLA